MKKSDIKDNLMPIYFEVQNAVQNEEGLSADKTKEAFIKLQYIIQQISLSR